MRFISTTWSVMNHIAQVIAGLLGMIIITTLWDCGRK